MALVASNPINEPVARWLSVFHWLLGGALAICLLGGSDLGAAPDAAEAPAVEPQQPIDLPKPVEPAEGAKPQAAGRLIRVPLPITGSVDTQVRRAVERALAELPRNAGRPILIFELYPTRNQFGEGSQFGRALDLARFLSSRDVSGAKTVAFIPRSIKGHGVLVAMACEEIVMAPDAQIGEAGIDEKGEEAIDPTVLSGYREIADRRRTIPAQVALGMLDKQVEVLEVQTEASNEFVLRSELDALRKKRAVQKEEILKPPGELATFSGKKARELGFAKYLAADRAALAKAFALGPEAVEDDPREEGGWRAIRIEISGPINAHTPSRVIKTIEKQLRDGEVNLICLIIESPGGSLLDSITIANFLADLDGGRVRTVAYLPGDTLGDAALVAIACDQVVMQQTATLGGAGAEEFSADELSELRETVRDSLAPKKGRSWSLVDALVDAKVMVYRYRQTATGQVAYMADEEAQHLPDHQQWKKDAEQPINRLGQPLHLTATEAEQFRLSRHTVADFSQFKQLYGVEGELALAEPGWADFLIDALASPGVAWMLLLIGAAALYAELQAPGVGVGGFVAGICFLLFFWSKHLDGTAGWLEVLLFMAGVVCILLELFVIPGSAIFGLGGGFMVIIAIILASQTFVWPHNEYQLRQVRDSMLGLLGVGVGVIVAGLIMRRYLPHTPLFGHMVLEPLSNTEMEDISHRESMVDLDHLLGARGTTTTPLMPAGKARFNGQLVDVSSSGEFVDRGTPIEVVEVQGNRVVVRPLAS